MNATATGDPGYGTEQLLVDFNSPTPIPAGYSLTGNSGYATGSATGMAAPFGDKTQYLYTSPSIPNGVATLTMVADLSEVSFYWGSIDDYNKVEVLGAGGSVLATISGKDIAPATGNQTSPFDNQRVFINGDGAAITGLRFTATGIAYEVDDVAGTFIGDGNPSPTPEPATWAMMIGGFAMVGIGARRRRHAALRVTA